MKLKFSDRERWLLFATILVVVLYILYQFLYLPKSLELASLNQKLDIEKQQLRMNEEKAKILENLEMAPLEKLRAQKSKEEQTIEALKYISSAVSKLNIDLTSIRPRLSEVTVGSAKSIFFDLNFVGKYNDIYRFMQVLENLPILILVDSMDMSNSGVGLVRVIMVLSVYY
jgi:Tfp pilus assembly protein PilO